MASFIGRSPMNRPKQKTMTIPTRANTKASGNHFSLHSASQRPNFSSRPSSETPTTLLFACRASTIALLLSRRWLYGQSRSWDRLNLVTRCWFLRNVWRRYHKIGWSYHGLQASRQAHETENAESPQRIGVRLSHGSLGIIIRRSPTILLGTFAQLACRGSVP